MSLVEHMVNCGIMFAFVRFRNNKMDDDNNNKKSTHVMCLRADREGYNCSGSAGLSW